MSKLPPEFVKAPSPSASAETAPRSRRKAKASIVAAEPPPPDPRQVLLHLSDEEHQALDDARQALVRVGETVTLEQIIHRVLTEWTMRTKLTATPEPAHVPRDESLLGRLRSLASQPLRTWRELGATLRRLSGLATQR